MVHIQDLLKMFDLTTKSLYDIKIKKQKDVINMSDNVSLSVFRLFCVYFEK